MVGRKVEGNDTRLLLVRFLIIFLSSLGNSRRFVDQCVLRPCPTSPRTTYRDWTRRNTIVVYYDYYYSIPF